MAKTILRGKALRPSAGIKAWYVKELRDLAYNMCVEVENSLKYLIRKQKGYAQDASPADERIELLERLQKRFEDMFAEKARELANSMLNRQNRYATNSVTNSIAPFAGETASKYLFYASAPLMSNQTRNIMRTAIFNNVNYIRSIQSQYFTQITGAVSRAVLDQEGLTYLAEQLAKYKGITKRRARNIAIDQTNKAYEALSYQKLKDVGIEKWEWVHGGGTKTVRHTHITDVKNGGINHSIHKMGEKVWDKQAFKKKGGGYRGEWIEPGQLPFCSCFRRPVITLGAD